MTSWTRKRPRQNKANFRSPATAIRSIVFFSLLYLYLRLVVEPCLIYGYATITNFPVFYRSTRE